MNMYLPAIVVCLWDDLGLFRDLNKLRGCSLGSAGNEDAWLTESLSLPSSSVKQ